jgi:hypothetical protein
MAAEKRLGFPVGSNFLIICSTMFTSSFRDLKWPKRKKPLTRLSPTLGKRPRERKVSLIRPRIPTPNLMRRRPSRSRIPPERYTLSPARSEALGDSWGIESGDRYDSRLHRGNGAIAERRRTRTSAVSSRKKPAQRPALQIYPDGDSRVGRPPIFWVSGLGGIPRAKTSNVQRPMRERVTEVTPKRVK